MKKNQKEKTPKNVHILLLEHKKKRFLAARPCLSLPASITLLLLHCTRYSNYHIRHGSFLYYVRHIIYNSAPRLGHSDARPRAIECCISTCNSTHAQPALVIIDLYVGFSYFYCRALFLSSPLIFYFIFLFSILITTGRHGTQYLHRYIYVLSLVYPPFFQKRIRPIGAKKKNRGYIRPITCCSFVFEIYILFEIPYRFLYIRRYSFYSLAGIVAFCLPIFLMGRKREIDGTRCWTLLTRTVYLRHYHH
jgi:hypothetical protein